jgi:hypothetical protein
MTNSPPDLKAVLGKILNGKFQFPKVNFRLNGVGSILLAGVGRRDEFKDHRHE